MVAGISHDVAPRAGNLDPRAVSNGQSIRGAGVALDRAAECRQDAVVVIGLARVVDHGGVTTRRDSPRVVAAAIVVDDRAARACVDPVSPVVIARIPHDQASGARHDS